MKSRIITYCFIIICSLLLPRTFAQKQQYYENSTIDSKKICVINPSFPLEPNRIAENYQGYFFLSDIFKQYKVYETASCNVFSFAYKSGAYIFLEQKKTACSDDKWTIRKYPCYDIFNTSLNMNFKDSAIKIPISDLLLSKVQAAADYAVDDYFLESKIATALKNNKNNYCEQKASGNLRLIALNYNGLSYNDSTSSFYKPCFLNESVINNKRDTVLENLAYNAVVDNIRIFFPLCRPIDVQKNNSRINIKQIADSLYNEFIPIENYGKRIKYKNIVNKEERVVSQRNNKVNIEVLSLSNNIVIANLWLVIDCDIATNYPLGYLVIVKFNNSGVPSFKYLPTFICYPIREFLL